MTKYHMRYHVAFHMSFFGRTNPCLELLKIEEKYKKIIVVYILLLYLQKYLDNFDS